MNNKKNLKSNIKNQTKLPSFLEEALIGILLGDGHLYRSSPTANTRVEWSFKGAYLPYALYVYGLFISYIGSLPHTLNTASSSGKKFYSSIRLKTLSLPLFNFYHELFYYWDTNKNKWIKIVPANIGDYMTPVVLAFLLISDGNFDQNRNRVRIYTNSFTHSDTILLANAIKDRLNINCSVLHDRNNQYIITIGAKQLPLLREIVADHIHPSMLYRIGLQNHSI